MTEIKCPYCGSTDTDYCNDNLDDLFAIDWHAPKPPSGEPFPFEFEYMHEYYCNDCGEYFTDNYKFTIDALGTEKN